MPPPLTHEQCQQEMCCCCGGKAGKRKISLSLGEKIRKYAQSLWTPDVVSFPLGICETCRKMIGDCERAENEGKQLNPEFKQRWQSFHLEDIFVPRGQLATKCVCLICKARKNHLFTKGVNHLTKDKKQIVMVEEVIEPAVTKNSAACTKCFQEKTGRGIPHPCTETSKKNNLVNLVLNQKEAGQEQIVSKVLKQVIENKEGEQGKEIKLNQLKGGNKLTVKIGQKKGEDGGIVDALTVAKLKKRMDLSDREVGTCLKILKEGKVKVEKNVIEVLKEIGRSLEEEYEDVKMNFEKSISDDDDEATKKTKKKPRKLL